MPAPSSTAEAFPGELTDRPRLRPVVTPLNVAQPEMPATRTPLLPPLHERLDARLQRKVVVDQGMEPASKEQYRRLAAGLHAAQAASGLRVVMMASAVASEGKSLTSSNLALTFSESYQRNVLLIDGDLRRPSLHTVFGLDAKPGLTEGLLSKDEQRIPLHRVSSRLTLLTAGEATTDPMGALASDRMRRLVEEARETFDWVFIDTPPIGLLSDASLLVQIADGAILVVKAGSTPHELVQRAVNSLGRDRILGVVLNQADPSYAKTEQYGYARYYKADAPSATGER
jgi:capsular exopolysaccharide synthesis family protein